MPSGGPTIEYRRYRAPQDDGEVFCDPPPEDLPRLVDSNQSLARESLLVVGDKPVAEIASQARAELVASAVAYTKQYADVSDAESIQRRSATLLVAGHQPQLFHPGVWFKNFILGHSARRVGGLGVNLIIDNDAAGQQAIRVPSGSVQNPGIETVAYDRGADESIPFEERTLVDRSVLESFAERVQKHLSPFVTDPLLANWWPRVTKSIAVQPNLGLLISQARHEQEIEWGLRTLELPLSLALDTMSFRKFVARIACDLSRFRDVYNRLLAEYRSVNGIRSRSHPAPELQVEDDWLEAPFWIWSSSDPRRRRLFVRRLRERFELTDRDRIRVSVVHSNDTGLEGFAEQVARLEGQGMKIRPRALMTTMYVRLFLCDLFIHGIGGGKYDQLTDAITRGYFGSEPPKFLVATATLRLPIVRPAVSPESLRSVAHELRDLEFNPDRHVAASEATLPHIESKRKWIATDPEGSGKERHRAIIEANAALLPFLADRRGWLNDERTRLERLLRHERILGSREYAFCLYPIAALQALLLDKS